MAKMTALKQTIRGVLYADAAITGYLGNPSQEPRRVYYWMPPDKPEFPFIVFWLTGGSYSDIGEDILSSAGDLSFNVWAKDDKYEDIAQRIVKLFHHKAVTGQRTLISRDPQELYDEAMDAYGRNLVFSLFHRRANI